MKRFNYLFLLLLIIFPLKANALSSLIIPTQSPSASAELYVPAGECGKSFRVSVNGGKSFRAATFDETITKTDEETGVTESYDRYFFNNLGGSTSEDNIENKGDRYDVVVKNCGGEVISHAYYAEEKEIVGTCSTEPTLAYEQGVLMTKKDEGSEVEEFYESIVILSAPEATISAGMGIAMPIQIYYAYQGSFIDYERYVEDRTLTAYVGEDDIQAKLDEYYELVNNKTIEVNGDDIVVSGYAIPFDEIDQNELDKDAGLDIGSLEEEDDKHYTAADGTWWFTENPLPGVLLKDEESCRQEYKWSMAESVPIEKYSGYTPITNNTYSSVKTQLDAICRQGGSWEGFYKPGYGMASESMLRKTAYLYPTQGDYTETAPGDLIANPEIYCNFSASYEISATVDLTMEIERQYHPDEDFDYDEEFRERYLEYSLPSCSHITDEDLRICVLGKLQGEKRFEYMLEDVSTGCLDSTGRTPAQVLEGKICEIWGCKEEGGCPPGYVIKYYDGDSKTSPVCTAFVGNNFEDVDTCKGQYRTVYNSAKNYVDDLADDLLPYTYTEPISDKSLSVTLVSNSLGSDISYELSTIIPPEFLSWGWKAPPVVELSGGVTTELGDPIRKSSNDQYISQCSLEEQMKSGTTVKVGSSPKSLIDECRELYVAYTITTNNPQKPTITGSKPLEEAVESVAKNLLEGYFSNDWVSDYRAANPGKEFTVSGTPNISFTSSTFTINEADTANSITDFYNGDFQWYIDSLSAAERDSLDKDRISTRDLTPCIGHFAALEDEWGCRWTENIYGYYKGCSSGFKYDMAKGTYYCVFNVWSQYKEDMVWTPENLQQDSPLFGGIENPAELVKEDERTTCRYYYPTEGDAKTIKMNYSLPYTYIEEGNGNIYPVDDEMNAPLVYDEDKEELEEGEEAITGERRIYTNLKAADGDSVIISIIGESLGVNKYTYTSDCSYELTENGLFSTSNVIVYRPIDLDDPFPRFSPYPNFVGFDFGELIGKSIIVNLTADTIKSIKEYNQSVLDSSLTNECYLDYNLNEEGESDFIHLYFSDIFR